MKSWSKPMIPRRITMKDIAEDLGVSVITVSKALGNRGSVSLATRRRVLKRAKELDYQPNLAARSLVTGRSFSIGLVVPDLVHPFFAEVAKGIARKIKPKGYFLIIVSTEEDPETEERQIQHLLARQVDAILIASTRCLAADFDKIERRNIPYVLIDRRICSLDANYVGVDDERLGAMAAEHLIACGCRRIAHIRGPEISTGVERLRGYRSALAESGLEVRPEYVVARGSSDDTADLTGYQAMRQLLRLSPPPDGVFCYNDPTAIGAMKAAFEAGFRVPEDVKLIGAGNDRYASELRVPLTSIDQGNRLLGQKAGQLVLSLLDAAEPPEAKVIIIPPHLIVRQSTRDPRVAHA
jgi:LacI family transcriptional regulator